MSDPALAAIASLQSSVTRLQAGLANLQAEVFGEVGATPLTALTSTVASEAVARESSGAVVAARIGILGCDTRDDRAAASATSFLTSRITSAEDPELHVKPGEAIELLRMGTVVFYGESARAIRNAQEVLRAAGAGQLEVVKRSNEPGESYIVIDGQIFIAKSTVESAARYPGKFEVMLSQNEQGHYHVAGVGLGDRKIASSLGLGPGLEDDVRRLLRDELKPGGMLHRC
ncbi:hypothetical protein [Pseudomonas putida]|uniref:hypothetical protein n=1 Tax=Pseudomonas putida TaxID=303 RepID=UPI002658FE21|nr:hypothetical protein [Pseudomonas putida]MCZ9639620.1 hypothetical protein [Pseudomonas putida]